MLVVTILAAVAQEDRGRLISFAASFASLSCMLATAYDARTHAQHSHRRASQSCGREAHASGASAVAAGSCAIPRRWVRHLQDCQSVGQSDQSARTHAKDCATLCLDQTREAAEPAHLWTRVCQLMQESACCGFAKETHLSSAAYSAGPLRLNRHLRHCHGHGKAAS